MKVFQSLVILGVSIVILASCGKKEAVAPVVSEKIATSADVSAVPTPEVQSQINAEALERDRINNLSALTEDNIKTQTEVQDGKTILKDRRLLVNYLTAEEINSADSLMAWLKKIKTFAQESGVELSDADIRTIIMATDAKITNWNMCGEFNLNKKKLDSTDEFYGYIEQACPAFVFTPPPDPKE